MPTVPDTQRAGAKTAHSGRPRTKQRRWAQREQEQSRRNQEWVWRGWFFGTMSIAVPLALLAGAPLPFPAWSLWACALGLIAVLCAFAAALTQQNLFQQNLARHNLKEHEPSSVPSHALRLTAALFLTLGFSYGTLACLIALRAGLESMVTALCLAPLLPSLISLGVWKREPVVPAVVPTAVVPIAVVPTAAVLPLNAAPSIISAEVTTTEPAVIISAPLASAPATSAPVASAPVASAPVASAQVAVKPHSESAEDAASQRDSMPTEPASRPTLTPSTRSPSLSPPAAMADSTEMDGVSPVRHSRMPTLPAPQSVAEQAALASASDYEVVIPRSPRAPQFAPEVLPRSAASSSGPNAPYQPNLEPSFRPTQRDRGQKRAPTSSPSSDTVSWNTTRTAEELDRELDQRFEALTSVPDVAKPHPAASPKPPLLISLDSGERPTGRSQFEIAYNSKGGPGYVSPADLVVEESENRADSSLPPARESSGPPAPLESAIRWANSEARPAPSLEQGLLETLHNARRVPTDAVALRPKAKTALH